jgi:glycosyltransferase involved in cell wall biosynthesis
MGVTLLISTYNRADQLGHSLQRLTSLTPPDELIVVDDGGSDNTEEVCQRFTDQLPIRYLYNNNPQWSICSFARNIGVKEASNEWIVTSEPELFWITDVIPQFLRRAEEVPDKVISAGTVFFGKAGYVPTLDVNGLEIAGDYTPPDGVQEAIGWVAPFTAMYHRDWLMRVGGWDEGFPGPWGWDDIDLLTRLRMVGIGQEIDLEVRALHQHHGPEHRGDSNFENEHYFFGKGFNGNESPDHPLVIANQEREWGVLRPRD